MGRPVGMKEIPGRQQQEREHLLKPMCQQDQPSVPLPVSSRPVETAEHVPAPSSSGMEYDTLPKPACANGVCGHFPSTAATVLPKPLIAAPRVGQRVPRPQPPVWHLLGLQTAGGLAVGFMLLLHDHAPPAPGAACDGLLSTQLLLMAGLSSRWGRARVVPWWGHVSSSRRYRPCGIS